MAQDAPSDGDHVEYCLVHPAFPPGVVNGNVQRGRLWVKPDNGGPKWSARVEDLRVTRRAGR